MIRKIFFSISFIASLISLAMSYISYNNFSNFNLDFNELDYEKEVIKKPIENTLPIELNQNNIGYYTSNLFTYYYFQNLYENKIQNNLGNCGYTAISMLLSYYDVYWNDNVILSKYESDITHLETFDQELTIGQYNSSRVIDNYNLSIDSSKDIEETNQLLHDFYDNSYNYKNNSLFALLLSYAHDNNIYQNNSHLTSFGVNADIMQVILKEYISNNSFLKNNVKLKYNELKKSSYQNLRNEVIQQLKNYNPVIVAGNRHVMVAYYYDEVNDIIYGNMGWGKNNTFGNINAYTTSDNGQGIYYYFYFDLNKMTHVHSNRYWIEDKLNSFCSCSLLSHAHNYIYKQTDNEFHLKKCICFNNFTKENHNYKNSFTFNYKEYVACSYCNFSKETTYTPTPID